MNIETDTGIDFKKLTPAQPRCMVHQLLIRKVNSPRGQTRRTQQQVAAAASTCTNVYN